MPSEFSPKKKTSIGVSKNKRQVPQDFPLWLPVSSVVKPLTLAFDVDVAFVDVDSDQAEANRSVGAPILQLGDRSSIIKKRVICGI
jgi:hypothetical protein